MDNRPIGVFDSGMGGASLLRNAVRMLPKENSSYPELLRISKESFF